MTFDAEAATRLCIEALKTKVIDEWGDGTLPPGAADVVEALADGDLRIVSAERLAALEKMEQAVRRHDTEESLSGNVARSEHCFICDARLALAELDALDGGDAK